MNRKERSPESEYALQMDILYNMIRFPELRDALRRVDMAVLRNDFNLSSAAIDYAMSLNLDIFCIAADVSDMRAKAGIEHILDSSGAIIAIKYPFAIAQTREAVESTV